MDLIRILLISISIDCALKFIWGQMSRSLSSRPIYFVISDDSLALVLSSFRTQAWCAVTTWPITANFLHKCPLVHHYSGFKAQVVRCHTRVTRGHWTLHVKKLRQCPIFTKFGMHMCIDETKRKVNYKFFVRGQELSLEVKRSFSLKMLLHLQIMTQDHWTWSVQSCNLASYKVFRDKGQSLHKGH